MEENKINESIHAQYENPSENRVWYDYGNEFRLKDRAQIFDKLENAVYTIHLDIFGFYLVKENDKFTFDYKLYGLEETLITRAVKYYNSRKQGNLGVLLNGLKGTGKTVTAKIIANQLNQPVILIAKPLKEIQNCHLFINSIPQNVTVFIDEYEKIFGQSSDMLTIMDGALNSPYRRVFLMTTNDLHVDRNLIERPSRVRYLKKFSHLSPQIVEEIIDDCLKNKKFKNDCIKFIASLETITVDIVKSVIEEVNVHNESPDTFGDIFNVKKLTGKFNIEVETGDNEYVTLVKNATVGVRPSYHEGHIGNYFSINDEYVGRISDILSWNVIEIEPMERETKKGKDTRLIKEPIIIKVKDADMAHYSYTYGYGETPRRERPSLPTKTDFKELAEAIGGKKTPFYGLGFEEDEG